MIVLAPEVPNKTKTPAKPHEATLAELLAAARKNRDPLLRQRNVVLVHLRWAGFTVKELAVLEWGRFAKRADGRWEIDIGHDMRVVLSRAASMEVTLLAMTRRGVCLEVLGLRERGVETVLRGLRC